MRIGLLQTLNLLTQTHTNWSLPCVFLLSLFWLLPLLFALPSQHAVAEEFKIDASHSALLFSIQHIGLGNTWGRFNDFGGTINFDAAKPEEASVSVVAKIASVDTNNAKRDTHIRNADLLDAGTFPEMTFEGKGFVPVADKEGHYNVTGTFTLRGKSVEVTVPFHLVGATTHFFTKKPAVGFEGVFSINPKEFGVGTGDVAAIIPDTMTITVALEALAE